MQKHIVRPLPDLSDVPQPANREEKLKIIIANLDEQQQDVRNSIIAEGYRELKALEDDSAQTQMDIDTDFASPCHDKLISDLSAPYDGKGDPCLSANGRELLEWPPKMSTSATASAKRIYQQVSERLEAYDKHARQVKQFYLQALERQRGGGSIARGSNAADPRRKSVAFAPGT